jgi:hypothetical protein
MLLSAVMRWDEGLYAFIKSLSAMLHYRSGSLFFTKYLARRTEFVNVALLCGVFIMKIFCKKIKHVQKYESQ